MAGSQSNSVPNFGTAINSSVVGENVPGDDTTPNDLFEHSSSVNTDITNVGGDSTNMRGTDSQNSAQNIVSISLGCDLYLESIAKKLVKR